MVVSQTGDAFELVVAERHEGEMQELWLVRESWQNRTDPHRMTSPLAPTTRLKVTEPAVVSNRVSAQVEIAGRSGRLLL